LEQLTDRVHWLSPYHETDRPILGVVAGQRATLLVDAGASPEHAGAAIDAISDRGLRLPGVLALTHWHWDHVFGTAFLHVLSFAHRETRRIVTRMAGFDWSDEALDRRVEEGTEIAFCRDMIKAEMPDRSRLVLQPPTVGFHSEVEIDLGGVTARLIHVGGDHAPDSTVVHVPAEGVVFLGDCIYRDLHHGPERYTTGTLFPLLERLLALDADHYVPSHHDGPLTRAQFAEEAALLRAVGTAVERHGEDSDAVRAEVPPGPHAELVEAFVAGLRRPAVDAVL
jgi:glyoxylase-like metal-dependent hydrolase (beta-lactamase superfamily II)